MGHNVFHNKLFAGDFYLLVHLLQGFFTNDFEIDKALLQNACWDRIVQLAAEQRVVPLLLRTAQMHPEAAIPANVIRKIEKLTIYNQKKNLFLIAYLIQIVELLKDHGIAAVPYKGPVAAELLYNDYAVRTYSDLDIIVKRKDAATAKNILLCNGFELKNKSRSGYEQKYLRIHIHYELYHPVNRIFLDLHWALTRCQYASSLSPENMFHNLRSYNFFGTKINCFSAEDTFFLMCEHGARHGWGLLIWLCDIAQAVKQFDDAQWEGLLSNSRRIGFGRVVLLGILLVNDLFHVTIPGNVSKRIQDDVVLRQLSSRVYHNLFSSDFQKRIVENPLFQLKLKERTSDKLRYCVRSLLIPSQEDWEAVPLPSSFFFLYYILRPVRLFVKHGISKFGYYR